MELPDCSAPPAALLTSACHTTLPVVGAPRPATALAPPLPTVYDLDAYLAFATIIPGLSWPADLTGMFPNLGPVGPVAIPGPVLPLPAFSQPCADLAQLGAPQSAAQHSTMRRQSIPAISMVAASPPSAAATGPATQPPPPLASVPCQPLAAAPCLAQSWQPTLDELYIPCAYGWPPLPQPYPASTDLPQPTRKRRREPRSRPAKRAAVSDSASGDTDSGMAAKKAQHECGQCGKRFPRPSGLAAHGYTHSGEKPHACPFPGCGKRFATVSNTKRHESTHRGWLPRRHNALPPRVASPVDLPCTATLAMPPAAIRHIADVPDMSTKI
ncbi:hypothetical protein H4R19_004026 [Coemansia spiralis]|nr:hypothetical protein H4R19_004026 [Coemansia spiralis]